MPSSNTMTITSSQITSMEYIGNSFDVTTGQSASPPPTFSQNGSTWTISIAADRSNSSPVATSFINATGGGGHQYAEANGPGGQPQELNFYFGVTIYFESSVGAVGTPVYFGQGHYSTNNNWWIGGNTLVSASPVLLQAISNNKVQAIFSVNAGNSSFTLTPWNG